MLDLTEHLFFFLAILVILPLNCGWARFYANTIRCKTNVKLRKCNFPYVTKLDSIWCSTLEMRYSCRLSSLADDGRPGLAHLHRAGGWSPSLIHSMPFIHWLKSFHCLPFSIRPLSTSPLHPPPPFISLVVPSIFLPFPFHSLSSLEFHFKSCLQLSSPTCTVLSRSTLTKPVPKRRRVGARAPWEEIVIGEDVSAGDARGQRCGAITLLLIGSPERRRRAGELGP